MLPHQPVSSRSAARRVAARIWRDRRGTAIIEFAICGGAFLALLMASLITALTMFAQQYVQTLTDQMARQVLTGKAQMAGTSAAQFKQQTCAKLPTFLSCSKVMIDLRRADNFSSADAGRPALTYDSSGRVTNNWAYDTVAPGDIVVLKIMYMWPVSNGPLGFSVANAGANTRLLVGTQVFKAETYS